MVTDDLMDSIHDRVANEILDVIHGDTYLKDAMLALLDILQRENKRSYDGDVIILKNVINRATLFEDLEKGNFHGFVKYTLTCIFYQ